MPRLRPLLSLLTIAVLSAAGLVDASPAAAAVTRTVVLQSSASAFARSSFVEAALPGYVIVGRPRGDNVTSDYSIYDIVAGTSSSLELDSVSIAAGNAVWGYNSADANPGVQQYYDLSSGDSGTVPTAWLVPTPGGGLIKKDRRDAGVIDLSLATYANPDPTAVHATVTMPAGTFPSLQPGPRGVLVLRIAVGSGIQSLAYVSYAPGATPVELRVPSGGVTDCKTVGSQAAACVTSAGAIARVALDGTTDPVVTEPIGGVFDLAVTNAATGWRNASGNFSSVAADGTGLTDRSGVASLGANDDTFYYTVDELGDDGGVFATRDAADPLTVRIQPPVADRLHSSDVTVSPGMAAWADDATTDYPLWRRTLAVGRSGLVQGARQAYATVQTDFGAPAASGARLAWARRDNSAIYYVDTISGLDRAVGVTSSESPQLSGTRLVYRDAATNRYRLLNLVTRGQLDVMAAYGAVGRPALFGDYLSFARSDGSIWRVRLIPGSRPVQLLRSAPADETITEQNVYAYGDWTAWHRRTSGRNDNGFRNARTLSPAVLVSVTAQPKAATSAGYIYDTDSESKHPRLRSWTSGTSIALPATDGGLPALHGSLVGYTAADHKPRVTLLTARLPVRPRSLGNASRPAVIGRGQTFALGLVTSAALTSCSVTFRRAGNVIATVACAAPYRPYGQIQAAWTATVGGKRVPAGAYSWTINAANADGALLNADGSGTATSGVVTVKA